MQAAALELFNEKGYDGTTAAEIAAHAGVTERTFFRHFPDKREVLFDGSQLQSTLTAAILSAPYPIGPLEMVLWAYKSAAPLFEENLRFAAMTRAVIEATPALQERQLAKAASIATVITESLQRRGIEPRLAHLTAATGMAVMGHGIEMWVQDPSLSLVDHLDQSFRTLAELSQNLP